MLHNEKRQEGAQSEALLCPGENVCGTSEPGTKSTISIFINLGERRRNKSC
jgi:hypothetical protein